MVECNLQLVDVSLELLLHAEQIALGLRLGIQGLLDCFVYENSHKFSNLDGIDGLLVELAVILELLLLLLDALLDLGSDLGDLDLASQGLRLLSLQGSFSLVQSSLQLVLLHFKSAQILGHLVSGSSGFAQGLEQVADLNLKTSLILNESHFVRQSLVLALQTLNLISQSIVLSSELVGFRG